MRIDVWYMTTGDAPDGIRLDGLRAILDAGELEHERRYRLERLRKQHVVTRALVRSALERLTGDAAESFRFVVGPYGKPRLVDEDRYPWRFSLSHADGAVLCAVADRIDLGADLERLDRRVNLDIAERYFTKREIAQIHAAPEADRPRRFLDFWTLKEAFLKAMGTGLATPLSRFTFGIDSPPPDRADPQCPPIAPRLEWVAPELGTAAEWRCRSFTIDGDYVGAVVARAPDASEIELTIRSCRPIGDRILPSDTSAPLPTKAHRSE